MREKIVFLIFLLIVLSLGGFLFRPFFNSSKEDTSIVSPVPNFLSIFTNKQVSTINLWFPAVQNIVGTNIKKPEITAKSAIVYDLTKKEVLYEKNPKEDRK